MKQEHHSDDESSRSTTHRTDHEDRGRHDNHQRARHALQQLKRMYKKWEKLQPDRKVELVFAGIVAVTTMIYSVFSIGLWRETGELARQAQKTNEIAIEASRAVFTTFTVTPQPRLSRIAIGLNTNGKSPRVLSLVTEMTIQKMADYSTVQRTRKEWVNDPRMSPLQANGAFDGSLGIDGDWPVDPVAREEAIYDTLWNELVTVRATVRYDSGFGRIDEQAFCQTLVADERINGPGKRLGITQPACGEAPNFIAARRQQMGLPPRPYSY